MRGRVPGRTICGIFRDHPAYTSPGFRSSYDASIQNWQAAPKTGDGPAKKTASVDLVDRCVLFARVEDYGYLDPFGPCGAFERDGIILLVRDEVVGNGLPVLLVQGYLDVFYHAEVGADGPDRGIPGNLVFIDFEEDGVFRGDGLGRTGREGTGGLCRCRGHRSGRGSRC